VTTVRFPTKVRLTVVAGQDCEPLIAIAVEAADAALSRAVRHAATLRLVNNAPIDPQRAPAIDVCIHGAELPPGIAGRLRAELTGLAAARAAELCSRPNVRATARQGELKPDEPVGEEYDDTKVVVDSRTPDDDFYLVPSYGSEGRPVALPVTGQSQTQQASKAAQVARPMHLRLVNIASRDALEAQIASHYGGAAPSLFVAIYRDAGRPMSVLLRVDPAGRIAGWAVLGELSVYEVPSTEGGGSWHPTALYEVDALEFYRDAASAEEQHAIREDILLDVLETSYLQIAQRQHNFPAYMKVTRALILLLLVDEPELAYLRETLNEKTSASWTSLAAGAAGSAEISAWFGASRLVIAALSQVDVDTSGPPQRGRIRYTQVGPQVQDSVGRWWSRAELDSVLAGGRQEAFAVDPLLEKISDLPDVVERLRSAGAAGVDVEFNSLLEDLRKENESKTTDVRDDVDIAFGLATFKEADITSASSIGAQLSGIHAQADAVLRPLYTGDAADIYAAGMRSLVSSELGKAGFMEFFNIVGLTVIAIFCPPAAFAIGAVEAASAVETALEHRGIQRAMLGGDEILSKAQAEAELWGAAIGAALVFLPEVPGIARAASRGAGQVVRGEVRQAAFAAGRELLQRAATHLAEFAAQDLARVFATECLRGYLLNLAINGAVGRLTDAVAREVAVTGHASVADLPRLVSDAISGPAQVRP
jgi:hypothetical protein